jgi:hypothetical protein
MAKKVAFLSKVAKKSRKMAQKLITREKMAKNGGTYI